MRKLLVIEDDLSIQGMLKSLFEMEGFETRTASNGHEGLDSLKDWRPDLIILDMKMPVMDGWEFGRRFRAEYDHAIPIVVLTAAADARQRARDVQAEAFVGKPFNVDALLSTVNDVLQVKQRSPV